MRQIVGGVAVLALLLAGCSSAPVGAGVRAACEDFSGAWANQVSVIHTKGPKADYDAAAVLMGNALDRGLLESTGDLKTAFSSSRTGLRAEQSGSLTLDQTSMLIRGYQQVISGCAALGVKVADSSLAWTERLRLSP